MNTELLRTAIVDLHLRELQHEQHAEQCRLAANALQAVYDDWVRLETPEPELCKVVP